MTNEKLAELCVDSYIAGYDNAIDSFKFYLSDIEKVKEQMRKNMLYTMLNKLENKQ